MNRGYVFILGMWATVALVAMLDLMFDNTMVDYSRNVSSAIRECKAKLPQWQRCSYEVIAYPEGDWK